MSLFNYYWHDRSFYYASITETEEHLRELNKIIVRDSQLSEFYRWKNFENAPYGKKKTIALMMNELTDRQLYLKVLPFIMQRFQTIERPFFLPTDMDTRFPRMHNAFLGPRFVNVKQSKCFIKNEREFLEYRAAVISNTISGNNLPEYCGLMLKHIIITEEGYAKARPLGDELDKLYKDMVALDRYIANGNWTGQFNVHGLQRCNVNISDESDSIKQNPKKKSYRYFKIPQNGSQYCFLHIKENNLRIHIYPDEKRKIVYVPYIGPHLPL